MNTNFFVFSCLLCCNILLTQAQAAKSSYCIVVSEATARDASWNKVVTALQEKHAAKIVTYTNNVEATLPALRDEFPRFTCFLATPVEATAEFVGQVHRLTRKFDNDPYADTFWGILTGYNADNALQIASEYKPLTIHKAAAGTEIVLESCQEGVWFCELNAGKIVRKKNNQDLKIETGPRDSTAGLVSSLNDFQPDLFVTSGHATERDWMLGFTYQNGFFKSKAGQMFGEDTQKHRLEISSANPKVYLAVGNCLMGNIDGPDAMALAWINDCGVRQMVGYTVPTWFGYGGWGLLDYFVEQPGRYTLNEAFMANHHALIYALETKRGDKGGLTYDRDVVAFYGDPAWIARMEAGNCSYSQQLQEKNGEYVFTITPNKGKESFHPVNKNGAQRGWRPIVQFLPHRMTNIKITSGEKWNAVVTDDFILVPNPREIENEQPLEIRFTAESFQ